VHEYENCSNASLQPHTETMAPNPPCDVPVGVITGDDVMKLHKHARDNVYAIPAFNCTRYVFATIYYLN